MSDEKPPLTLIQGGGAISAKKDLGGMRPSLPPSANLDTSGRRVWDYLCDSLIAAGVDISTSGISLLMITRMYLDWIKDVKLCQEDGRYGKGKKGGQFELPHSYNERKTRSELQSCLPASCLTAMSLVEAKLKQSRTGESGQLDLEFGELVAHATADRRSVLPG